MSIKSITVHPKGATHVQVLNGNTYFLKQTEGVWFFKGKSCSNWLLDKELNDDDSYFGDVSRDRLKKLGEVNVNPNSASTMPPMGVSFDNEVLF